MSEEKKETFNLDMVAAETDTAQDHSNKVLGSSVAADEYAAHFADTFVFFGRSLEDWSRELQVFVPARAQTDPHEIQKLWIELANNIQTAAHFKAVASSIYTSMQSGVKIQKDDLVRRIVAHYAACNMAKPAAKVLDSIAESYLQDSTLSRESAKLVKEFWNQKYDALVEVRKCLEQLGMSIITEHKYASGGEQLD